MIIDIFWEIMGSYDNNERAEFLQFVTIALKEGKGFGFI
jgi:hypothetical protein